MGSQAVEDVEEGSGSEAEGDFSPPSLSHNPVMVSQGAPSLNPVVTMPGAGPAMVPRYPVACIFIGLILILPVAFLWSIYVDIPGVVTACVGLTGAIALLVVMALLALCRAFRLAHPAAPSDVSEVRTCVWELLSYGELINVQVVVTSQAGHHGSVADSATKESPPEPTGTTVGLVLVRAGQTTCPCCMDEFSEHHRVAVPRCGHVFCEACLREWAASAAAGGSRCPACRASLTLEDV